MAVTAPTVALADGSLKGLTHSANVSTILSDKHLKRKREIYRGVTWNSSMKLNRLLGY